MKHVQELGVSCIPLLATHSQREFLNTFINVLELKVIAFKDDHVYYMHLA